MVCLFIWRLVSPGVTRPASNSCCKSSKVSYLPAISFKHWFESMTLIPIYCLMFPSDKTGPIVDWIPTWHPPFIISWFYDFPRLICHLTVSCRNKFDPKYRCQIFDEQMLYLNGMGKLHLILNNIECFYKNKITHVLGSYFGVVD